MHACAPAKHEHTVMAWPDTLATQNNNSPPCTRPSTPIRATLARSFHAQCQMKTTPTRISKHRSRQLDDLEQVGIAFLERLKEEWRAKVAG